MTSQIKGRGPGKDLNAYGVWWGQACTRNGGRMSPPIRKEENTKKKKKGRRSCMPKGA